MISIVTGTLNRKNFLPDLIKNTVDSDERLELVLVDGGSTDGTIEYIKNLNHNNIKLIEVGHRSPYPHFMNLGIKNSKYEWICQWNDDVLLVNNWSEIISELDNKHDFYIFNWKYGEKSDLNNYEWNKGTDSPPEVSGWCIVDDYSKGNEIIMNYGIYNKKIFREIGMYSNSFRYYYADGDMSLRAHLFGYKHKGLKHIKVCSIQCDKRAINDNSYSIYQKNHENYKNKILDKNIEILL